jgi:hypothetical protein
LSTNQIKVEHSGIFKYTLENYYLIPSYDRNLWENIKNGPGDPYGNARVLIELFNKYIREQSTGYMSLVRGIQIDLAERWIKQSELATREEPDIVY